MTRPAQRLRHEDRGSYTIELLGLLPLFTIIALLAFQLASIGGAMNMAENAARNGSRAAGMGRSAQTVGLDTVDPGMRDRTSISQDGETVTVRIDVPIVIPFVDATVTTIERSATLPSTVAGGV